MMRKLYLKIDVLNRFKYLPGGLRASDIDEPIKSFPPGEWIEIIDDKKKHFVGFINPLVENNRSAIFILDQMLATDPVEFICHKIKQAKIYRDKLVEYPPGQRRLFYGDKDGLPGLVIDEYLEVNLIQINTAGLDRYRNEIQGFVTELTNKKTILIDKVESRKKESLPFFSDEIDLEYLVVNESGFHYKIEGKKIQKLGYYYDHRENRKTLEYLLNSEINFKIESGLDLFSYLGSWSKHALRAGVNKVTLVDQGNLEDAIRVSFNLDGFLERYDFFRGDVFSFLDNAIEVKKKWQLVMSDPPAFAKSPAQKSQAIDGYKKLHRKIFQVVDKESIIVFASCTKYVNYREFQNTIQEMANQTGAKIKLLKIGNQGLDHPHYGEGDSAFYIKSLIYYVEKL